MPKQDKNGIKMGTKSPKWEQEHHSGTRIGKVGPKWDKNGNKVRVKWEQEH